MTLPVQAEIPDPMNATQIDGRSYLELPTASKSPWLEGDEVAEGEVERYSIESKILDERRFVYVYTPAGYDSMTEPLNGLYLLAGEDYASRRNIRATLDFLIATKKIPPFIAVMVQSEGSRRKDLPLDDAHVRFLGEEVVAWARSELDIAEGTSASAIGGNRIGAALAVAAALRYPHLFGSVLTQSAVFPTGSLTPIRELVTRERTPMKYHVEVGTLDGPAVIEASAHLRDVLEAKGYPVTYREFSGNQSSRTWQDSLAIGLLRLFGK